MGTATKRFLLLAASVTCTVILIFYGFKIFGRSKDFSENMSNMQEKEYARIEEYPITRYDGYYIRGSTACGYIKSLVGEYGIMASVTTDNGTFEVVDDTLFSCFRDPVSDYYINPLKEYLCSISRDANGVIREVTLSVKTP